MDFQYYGANCIKISNKKVTILIDDDLSEHGLKSVASSEDVAIFTIKKDSKNPGRFKIEGPGEYEIAEVSVKGIPARAHLDEMVREQPFIIFTIKDFRSVLSATSIPILPKINWSRSGSLMF